jgi:hypothetical protein
MANLILAVRELQLNKIPTLHDKKPSFLAKKLGFYSFSEK